MEKKIITKENVKFLQNKIAESRLRMKKVVEELRLARLDGDISENADFALACEKFEKLQELIFSLEKILEESEVSEKPEIKEKSHIQLGSKVTYQILKNKKNQKNIIKIVSKFETNPSEGKISFDSPLGSLLLNKKKGVIVEFRGAYETYQIKILEIK